MKRVIYNFIIKIGLKILGKLFPDIHRSTPLKPSDRYLECHFVFSHLPEDKKSKILDVGCSGSFFPLTVAALGYDVTGCDIRPYEIVNNIEFKNFRFLQQDISKEKIPEESFDCITCISVLEHIGLKGQYGSFDNPKGDEEMMKTIRGLLKPNGRALITLPYGISKVFPPYLRIYDYNRVKELSEGFSLLHQRYFYMDEKGDWKECLAEEGQLKPARLDHYGLALLCLEKI